MYREISFLDLTDGRERVGQFWSTAPLVLGRTALWLVSDGRPVHVHRPHARHRATQRALSGRTAEWITGVGLRAAWSDVVVGRHDLTR